jgi:excisionase family DNA binding protein
MTVGHVARMLGVAERTVSKWCDRGALKSHRIPMGVDRRIYAHHFEEFLKEKGWPVPACLSNMVRGGRNVVLYRCQPAVVVEAVRRFRDQPALPDVVLHLFDCVWNLAHFWAAPDGSGVLVVGSEAAAAEAEFVFARVVHDLWKCCVLPGPDQRPLDGDVSSFREEELPKFWKSLEFHLSQVS